MSSLKDKVERYEIVALMGAVRSPISRLVPVVSRSNSAQLIVVGSGLKRTLSGAELNELVETGQAVRLPNHYSTDTYAPGMKPTVVSKSQAPMSLPYYALYIDESTPGFQSIGDLRGQALSWPSPLLDDSDRRIWVLPNNKVHNFFRTSFEKLADEFECLLADFTCSEDNEVRTKGLRSAEMRSRAEVLFRLAFDAQSSEQAIAYGAYLKMNNPRESARWYHWVTLACRLWKLETSQEHWVQLLSAKSDAIRLRAYEVLRDKNTYKAILDAINDKSNAPVHSSIAEKNLRLSPLVHKETIERWKSKESSGIRYARANQ